MSLSYTSIFSYLTIGSGLFSWEWMPPDLITVYLHLFSTYQLWDTKSVRWNWWENQVMPSHKDFLNTKPGVQTTRPTPLNPKIAENWSICRSRQEFRIGGRTGSSVNWIGNISSHQFRSSCLLIRHIYHILKLYCIKW